MSQSTVDSARVQPVGQVRASPRTWRKALLTALRRGHLYLGLFLFPWAILYGVTAFLFNHPTVASDQPIVSFDATSVAGTPLATLPTPDAQAAELIALLNALQHPMTPYRLAGSARYGTCDFAFATGKTEGATVSILIDLAGPSGTIRLNPDLPKPTTPPAPFAFGSENPAPSRAPSEARPVSTGLVLAEPLPSRLEASLPMILERNGFPAHSIRVTSVPDLIVPIEADGQIWQATYQPMTGSLTGIPADLVRKPDLSTRRFLLRLHTAHGYPSSHNSRWFWAIAVDAMAITLCFWGLTGLIMWWAIKSTRTRGILLVLAGILTATTLAWAMHNAMTS